MMKLEKRYGKKNEQDKKQKVNYGQLPDGCNLTIKLRWMILRINSKHQDR